MILWWRFKRWDLQIAFAILLAILGFLFFQNNFAWWYVGFALPFLVLCNYQSLLLAICLMVLFWLFNSCFYLPKHVSYLNGNFRVMKMLNKGVLIHTKKGNIFVVAKHTFYPGELIHLKGKVTLIQGPFAYYFKSLNTYQILFKPKELKLMSKTHDWRSIFEKYLEHQPHFSSNYFNLLLLGKKNASNRDLFQQVLDLNIVHLFVISGLHFSLLYLFISKCLRLFLPSTCVFILTFTLLLIYAYCLRFKTPVLRSISLIFLLNLQKMFKWNFSRIMLLNFVCLMMILLKLQLHWSYSFYLTFLAAYIILGFLELKFQSKVKQWLSLHLVLYLTFLPYQLSTNHTFNLWGLIWSGLFGLILPFYYLLGFVFICVPDWSLWFWQSLNLLLNWAHKWSIIWSIPGFTKWWCSITYILFLNLFIIYPWLNYFVARKLSWLSKK